MIKAQKFDWALKRNARGKSLCRVCMYVCIHTCIILFCIFLFIYKIIRGCFCNYSTWTRDKFFTINNRKKNAGYAISRFVDLEFCTLDLFSKIRLLLVYTNVYPYRNSIGRPRIIAILNIASSCLLGQCILCVCGFSTRNDQSIISDTIS